ncbi:hypothetical protein ACFLZT_03415 [Thermodesulfobacteriota bacterium]
MKTIKDIIPKFLGREKKELDFDSLKNEICITCRGKGTVVARGVKSPCFACGGSGRRNVM